MPPPSTCLAHNNTPLLTVAHVDHPPFIVNLYSIINILSILLLSDKKKCRQS